MKCPYRQHKVVKKTKVVTTEDVQNTEEETVEYLDCYTHDCPYYSSIEDEDGTEEGICNKALSEIAVIEME